MQIEPGRTYNFIVDRETEISYILKYKDEELFLHKKEAFNITTGMHINAFVYVDSYKRNAATMMKPFISLGIDSWLEVKSVVRELGVFLDMGINKDLILSKEYLPEDFYLWPKINDFLYVTLKSNKRLYADFSRNYSLENKSFTGNEVKGRVIKHLKEGIRILTKDLIPIFVYKDQFSSLPRIGEEVEVKIINSTEKGLYGSLELFKEKKRILDSEKILNELKKYGKINLDSNSTPECIEEKFSMSKKAFKRALGYLYKKRIIKFEDGLTIYKEKIE